MKKVKKSEFLLVKHINKNINPKSKINEKYHH